MEFYNEKFIVSIESITKLISDYTQREASYRARASEHHNHTEEERKTHDCAGCESFCNREAEKCRKYIEQLEILKKDLEDQKKSIDEADEYLANLFYTDEQLAAREAGLLSDLGQICINSAYDYKLFKEKLELIKKLCIRFYKDNSIDIPEHHIYNQTQEGYGFDNNCCKTTCYMLAQINSDGKLSSNGTTDKIGNYVRETGDVADYCGNDQGFYDYQNLSIEDLTTIIAGEIDSGRVVQLHTRYVKDEHWVIVTGYSLDSEGNIKLDIDEAKHREYITGLSGIDPWPACSEDSKRQQVTDDLGKSATVSSIGQWLNTDAGGYQVRTFNP